jgi:hypothetical protein
LPSVQDVEHLLLQLNQDLGYPPRSRIPVRQYKLTRHGANYFLQVKELWVGPSIIETSVNPVERHTSSMNLRLYATAASGYFMLST